MSVVWDVEPITASRIFVTERPGRVRLIRNGVLQSAPYATIPVAATGQGGLFDLCPAPDYATSKKVYLTYTVQDSGGVWLRLTECSDTGSTLTLGRVIFNGPKSTDPSHFGGRMTFGPNGNLYLTLGERHERDKAPDPKQPYGKVMRIDPRTRAARVFTRGHRNPYGLAYNASNGTFAEAEHGPSGYDAPGGFDEVNVLAANGDYGWPRVWGSMTLPGTKPPERFWESATPPGGLVWHRNNLLMTALGSQELWRINVQNGRVIGSAKVDGVSAGRLRGIGVLPDNSVLIGTSNSEGGGTGDKVIRVTGL
ncbi:hypothetical protein EON81_16005 [bacterium]|nr:MAG: hypothetical protein EON81_16005 [bacterium]